MVPIRVAFTAAAVPPDCRPTLPRSGACCVALPPWHPHEAIMVGGYTEERMAQGVATSGTAARTVIQAAPLPRREPTIEAWTFSSEGGGCWHPVENPGDGPVPQPRLTCQAAVVGDELWLVGGWDPSAPPGETQFLNDVWALNLHDHRWRQVELRGEQMPRISRFALSALPGGRLLIHSHRSLEDVLLLDTGVPQGAGGAGAHTPARLQRVLVRGIFPDGQCPASRGLHSLTLAAAPPSPAADAGSSSEPGKAAGSGPRMALYLYGGAPQSGPMFGDLWALDLDNMTWQELKPEAPAPQARCSHVAAGCGSVGTPGPRSPLARYLLVMGGSYYVQQGRLQPLDDVVAYDTQTNRWVEVKVEGPRPSPRNAAVIAPLERRPLETSVGPASAVSPDLKKASVVDRYVLHGGWRPFVETYDDTYVVTVTAEMS